jgi:hypothetical protein
MDVRGGARCVNGADEARAVRIRVMSCPTTSHSSQNAHLGRTGRKGIAHARYRHCRDLAGPHPDPLVHATRSDNDVLVPYDKQLVKDAPRVDVDQHLSEAEERQLWRHYGLDYDTTERTGRGRDAIGRDRLGRDTSGPTTGAP